MASAIAAVKAGTYTGSAKGYDSQVVVEVKVDKSGKIQDVKIKAEAETPKIGGEAAPKMAARIKAAGSTKVDVVSGATHTSKAVINAVKAALKKAGVGAADKTEDKPQSKDEEITVDVGIIGGGASGTAAAAAAIDGGAKVLMVEKTGHIGGISRFFAGGPFAVESHVQKEAGR